MVAIPLVTGGGTYTWQVTDSTSNQHTVRGDDCIIGDHTAIFTIGRPPQCRVVGAFSGFTSVVEKPGGVA